MYCVFWLRTGCMFSIRVVRTCHIVLLCTCSAYSHFLTTITVLMFILFFVQTKHIHSLPKITFKFSTYLSQVPHHHLHLVATNDQIQWCIHETATYLLTHITSLISAWAEYDEQKVKEYIQRADAIINKEHKGVAVHCNSGKGAPFYWNTDWVSLFVVVQVWVGVVLWLHCIYSTTFLTCLLLMPLPVWERNGQVQLHKNKRKLCGSIGCHCTIQNSSEQSWEAAIHCWCTHKPLLEWIQTIQQQHQTLTQSYNSLIEKHRITEEQLTKLTQEYNQLYRDSEKATKTKTVFEQRMDKLNEGLGHSEYQKHSVHLFFMVFIYFSSLFVFVWRSTRVWSCGCTWFWGRYGIQTCHQFIKIKLIGTMIECLNHFISTLFKQT